MLPRSLVPQRLIGLRLLIFLLASSSFACLLGTFYGFWLMRAFACWVYLPAVVVLAFIAWRQRGQLPGRWIVQGALGGLVAAVAYDLFRLPFVLNGAPLFKVFPQFGEMLLGHNEPRWLVNVLGWSYHFSNGAALGIMFLAALARPTSGRLFWGAVVWALMVEMILLSTPYPGFFGIPFNERFLILTLSAHLVFGIALGLWCRRISVMHGLVKRFAMIALALFPAANADAALGKLGALGDSLTDEYWDSGVASYASDWVSLLVTFRGVDCGPTAAQAGTGTWGEPRNAGYKFNWRAAGPTLRLF
jgi:hypothetical protein